MTPAEVPAELVEKAARAMDPGAFEFPEECAGDIECARAEARHALAAVLPEVRAQALRDAADDVSAAPHWPDEDRYTMGWEDAIREVRKRAARLTATTEGTAT